MADDSSPTSSLTPELLRSDTKILMGYINGARAVAIGRETIIHDLKGWLVACLISGLLVSGILIGIAAIISQQKPASQWPSMATGFVMILAAGRTGAITSVLRRIGVSTTGNIMSVDAILELAGLELGKIGFRAAIWSATVFAFVVYLVFASGLPAVLGFSGGFAPAFVEVERTAAADRIAVLAQASFTKTGEAEKEEKFCDQSTRESTPSQGNEGSRDAEAKLAAPINQPSPSGSSLTPTGSVSSPSPKTDADKEDSGAQLATSGAGQSNVEEACQRAQNARKDADDALSQAQDALKTSVKFREADFLYGSWTNRVAEALGVATVPDLFKLLVWAFLAGWAEQLVPDILNSIRRKHESGLRRDVEASAGQPTVPPPST